MAFPLSVSGTDAGYREGARLNINPRRWRESSTGEASALDAAPTLKG
jgi:hypothetical protein